MHFSIPREESPLIIDSLILDLNGTLAIDGVIIPGVADRLAALRKKNVKLFLFTGDTQGNGARIAADMGLELRITRTAEEKMNEAIKLGPETCVAIGNGKIDTKVFQVVRLKIAVIQAEGVYKEILLAADMVMPNINDALDFLLNEKRLIAGLRH